MNQTHMRFFGIPHCASSTTRRPSRTNTHLHTHHKPECSIAGHVDVRKSNPHKLVVSGIEKYHSIHARKPAVKQITGDL